MGVCAASGGRDLIQKGRGSSLQPCWRVSGRPGAAKTIRIDDFRPAQKSQKPKFGILLSLPPFPVFLIGLPGRAAGWPCGRPSTDCGRAAGQTQLFLDVWVSRRLSGPREGYECVILGGLPASQTHRLVLAGFCFPTSGGAWGREPPWMRRGVWVGISQPPRNHTVLNCLVLRQVGSGSRAKLGSCGGQASTVESISHSGQFLVWTSQTSNSTVPGRPNSAAWRATPDPNVSCTKVGLANGCCDLRDKKTKQSCTINPCVVSLSFCWGLRGTRWSSANFRGGEA